MSQTSDALVVLTTVDDRELAGNLAGSIVEAHLAACVQILPGMTSVYRWQGRVESADELLLLIKTTSTAFPELESFIKANHPYQTPEILALPVKSGSDDYLDWLAGSVKPSK